MSDWQRLLDRTIAGLDRLRTKGRPVPDWVLGGGTALMIHTGHRLSRDIDAFIDDPQYISILSPRLAGEEVWACSACDEAANYLKLRYPEGEVDFIVAAPITGLPAERRTIETGSGASHVVVVEHPVEIALKKLNYRGSALKVRDIFDIAVVDSRFPGPLQAELHHVAHLKSAIVASLAALRAAYVAEALEELAIDDRWRPLATKCLERVKVIADGIPG